MYPTGWSIESPLSPLKLAERISSAPRWNGWRDGFNDGRFLISDNCPVYSGTDGFRFVVALNPRCPIAIRGTYHASGEMTRIVVRANPPLRTLMALGMATLPICSVPLVLLWSVNLWLAIGIFFVCLIPVGLIMSAGYWWNVKVVRKRINEWLLATKDTKELPNVM